MGEIFLYLWSVVSHWVVLMSGSIILVGIAVWERIKGITVPKKIYVGIASAFIFVACFLAWQEKHRELTKTQEELVSAKRQLTVMHENAQPQLTGKIDSLYVTKEQGDRKATVVVITMTVSNIGAPSIVEGYSLRISTPQKRQIKVEGPTYFQNGLRTGGQRYVQDLSPDEYIVDKTAQRLIQKGGRVSGVLIYTLETIPIEEINQPGTVYTIFFRDIYQKPYEAGTVLVRSIGEAPPIYIPGIKPNVRPNTNSSP